MECYLDNSATTRVDPEAAGLVQRIMLEDYGNPSSLHGMGFRAEKHIREAKEIFAKLLKCRDGEIYFTSGGTESDNLALIGAYMANRRRGKRIISTGLEHDAVSRTLKHLEEVEGAQIVYLKPDDRGHISINDLKEALTEDTILVSIMHVNNEIGSIEPIQEAGKVIHEINPECLFHVDDIQGFGKLKLIPGEAHVDLLSVSSHKIHGPKGVGLLYKSDRARLEPVIFGGGHQKGLRSGTENVPGIAGFALAAKKMYDELDSNYAAFCDMRKILLEEISPVEDIKVNGGDAPYIISLSVKNVRAEVLLHALEEKGIYVSAGSACSSNRPHVSETLKAIDADKWQLDSTIRISLSPHNTSEEMRYTAEELKEIIPRLRMFTRR